MPPPGPHFDAHIPRVSIGLVRGEETRTLLRIHGETILWIDEPTGATGTSVLSARLRDEKGRERLAIEGGVCRLLPDGCHASSDARSWSLRNARGAVVLAMSRPAPDEVVFEKIALYHRNCFIWLPGPDQPLQLIHKGVAVDLGAAYVVGSDCVIDVHAQGVDVGSEGVVAVGDLGPENKQLSFASFFDRFGAFRRNAGCLCMSGARYKHCCGPAA